MDKKLEQLQKRVPTQHKDLAKYTQHVFEAIDKVVDEHRRLVAIDALAGIKPDGEKEHDFYEHMNSLKKIMLAELEKTVQDIEHLGDKTWDKNFKDGIKE